MSLTIESIQRALAGLHDDERAELTRTIRASLEALSPMGGPLDRGLRERFGETADYLAALEIEEISSQVYT